MLKKFLCGTQDEMRGYGVSKLWKQGKILEVGCNDGVKSSEYFNHVSDRYIGIDNQLKKIKFAKRFYPHFRFYWTEVLSAKGKKLIRKSDILVSFQTLEHIGTPGGDEDLLILKWVRQGKQIIISVPNFNSAHHVRFYDEEIWTKRFKKLMQIDEICIYNSLKPSKKNICSYLYIGTRL